MLVLPLSLQPTLTSLRYFTFAGLSSMLFTTVVVVAELVAGGSARYRPPGEQLKPGLRSVPAARSVLVAPLPAF